MPIAAGLLSPVRTAVPLLCPLTARPISRAVVLDWPRSDSEFLPTAAAACRTFGITPVVLTLARLEGEASRRQQRARALFRSYGVPADFDYATGTDAHDALIWAARWRNCPHAIAPAGFANGATRQTWRQGSFGGDAYSLREALTVLTITKDNPGDG